MGVSLTGKSCYVCGKPASSSEHVPPRAIFPTNGDVPSEISFRRELITVPSCDDHNLRKSKDDEYLMMVLVAHFENNHLAGAQMRTKVMRAWTHNPHLANVAVQKPVSIQLNGQETMAFKVDLSRLYGAMELIARGLVFHTTGSPWVGGCHVWGLNMLPSKIETVDRVLATSQKIKDMLHSIFGDTPFLGANPLVFKYQIYLPVAPETLGCVRLVFYEGLEIAVFLGPVALGDSVLGEN